MTRAAIELTNLGKHFGATRAVQGVSLTVPEGAVYGLIGPNGAGKTTTFSMLAGYVHPTSGSARVLGCAPTDVRALKGRVGVLPQDALLPANERVGAFVTHLARLQGMAPGDAQRSARAALARVEGADWWSTKCGALSHGMAKRVGLAQALLGAPALVLLDEPTAGLDPKVAYSVRQLIASLGGGACTVVVSSHNLQELEQVCSGAAILDRGRLVASGTLAELTSSSREVQIELGAGPAPLDAVRVLDAVTAVRFDDARRVLSIAFDPQRADAEAVIGASLRALLDHGARIAGVSKGRGLEQRVIELT